MILLALLVNLSFWPSPKSLIQDRFCPAQDRIRLAIHVHGADGYRGGGSTMYADVDAQRAIFTWVAMNYCCSTTESWSAQAVLYPNGSFSIYQTAASTDLSRYITIGLSDGVSADNSVAGANGLDWDTQPIGVPFGLGQVDFGSSETGGMATGRFLFFEYDSGSGYTGTVVF